MNEIKINVKSMLCGSFNRMSHVNRYSSIPVMRKENVAEHSWYVALYSYIIAQDLQRNGTAVDLGKLLSRALLHDLDESHTGDFLRVVKYGHPDLKKALDEISISMMRKMSDEVGADLLPPWECAKDDDIEGEIIKVVDLARVVSYVLEEVKSGNRHISPILDEVSKYLTELVDGPLREYVYAIVEVIHDYSMFGFKYDPPIK